MRLEITIDQAQEGRTRRHLPRPPAFALPQGPRGSQLQVGVIMEPQENPG